MRKSYIPPMIKIYSIKQEFHLLAGSPPVKNPPTIEDLIEDPTKNLKDKTLKYQAYACKHRLGILVRVELKCLLISIKPLSNQRFFCFFARNLVYYCLLE